jgi:BRCT domain type II-containing protein
VKFSPANQTTKQKKEPLIFTKERKGNEENERKKVKDKQFYIQDFPSPLKKTPHPAKPTASPSTISPTFAPICAIRGEIFPSKSGDKAKKGTADFRKKTQGKGGE